VRALLPISLGNDYVKTLLFSITLMRVAFGQNPPVAQTPNQQTTSDQTAPAPTPTPLPTPAITGPLQAAPPTTFDLQPSGKIAINGTLTGMGLWQGNHVPGDEPTQAALSNGQIFLQKTEGWFQFYLQAGAYNIPALGVPFLATDKTLSNF
jgi:hypothetical protein